MQNKNSKAWGLSIKTVRKNSLEKSKYLNLPDLQFFQWCHQRFGLNKGVYNTIDNWFYDYGIVNILHRRIYLLAFLDFVKDAGLKQDNHKFIRFGNGGLIRKLHEFIREKENEKYII
ncbi:hypothetical protein [Bacillus methanolicus]|uniref:hypothetical protein n=1 Tax=Bacillus methanolicus TaxID=1471 RepID=UPI002380A0B5|nr:hypothetical protein [Bacillus methanolicus]